MSKTGALRWQELYGLSLLSAAHSRAHANSNNRCEGASSVSRWVHKKQGKQPPWWVINNETVLLPFSHAINWLSAQDKQVKFVLVILKALLPPSGHLWHSVDLNLNQRWHLVVIYELSCFNIDAHLSWACTKDRWDKKHLNSLHNATV